MKRFDLMLVLVVLMVLAGTVQAEITYHWKLDEIVAGPVVDDNGNLNITNNGAIIKQPGPTPGDWSYLFDDPAAVLNTGSTNLVPATADWSVTVTFFTQYDHPSGDQGQIFSNNDGADPQRGSLYVYKGVVGYWQKDGPAMASSARVDDGSWHTVMVTRVGSDWALYLDDMVTPVSTASYAGTVAQSVEWVIGNGSAGYDYDFHGYISDVELTVPEPATLFLLGLGGLLLRRRK